MADRVQRTVKKHRGIGQTESLDESIYLLPGLDESAIGQTRERNSRF